MSGLLWWIGLGAAVPFVLAFAIAMTASRKPPPGGHLASLVRRIGPPLLVFVVAVAIWQAATVILQIQPFLLPSPVAIATEAASRADLLAKATWNTFAESLAGFLLSTSIGTLSAFLFTRARWVERSFVPYAIFLQTVPVVAVAPLLVLWLGVGFKAVAAASFIVAVFPIITAATAGLHAVDPELRALFRLYRASRWQTFVKLEAPAAIPYLLSGLRSASGLSVIGAVVGEFVAGGSDGKGGLGSIILASSRQMQTPLLFAAIICCSVLGLALFGVVSALGDRWLDRWHPSSQETR